MKATRLVAPLIACVLLLPSCARRGAPEAEPAPATPEAPAEVAPAADPRARYETTGSLPGLAPSLAGATAYLAAKGDFVAGPLGTGLDAAPLVAVARTDAGGELVALDLQGKAVASVGLPGVPLAFVASKERLAIACLDGSLLGLAIAEEEGGGALALVEKWRQRSSPVDRLVPLPGDRMAVAREDGSLSSLDAATGSEVWRAELGSAPTDLAYAVGLVLACAGNAVSAFAEESGSLAWKTETEAPAGLLAAGGGLAALLDARGRITFLDAKDGRVLSEAPGPFDPAIRPLLDAGSGFAAVPGGGAVELVAKTGAESRSWPWRGSSSFLAFDEGSIYGSAGARLLACPRYADSPVQAIELEGEALGAPARLETKDARLALRSRGGIAIVGERGSVLGAALDPDAETAAAIEGALSGLGGAWAAAAPKPRYGVFAAGLPVYPEDGFAALRYDPPAKGKRVFAASPDPGDAILVLFDEKGRKLASNVDELGGPGKIELWLEAGRTYWIAAGGRGGRIGGEYRLLLH